MPYHVIKRGDKWCVTKKDGSKTFGCHPSEAQANKQLAALYANEPKFKDYDAAQRKSLAAKGHALSDGSYPIADAEDVHNAISLARSGHGNVSAAMKLIKRRAKELSVALPANMSFIANFDADVKLVDQGDNVIRIGTLFECGSYSDKDFSLSNDEADVAISNFEPFDINIEHVPSIFDGKLGRTNRIWRDSDKIQAEFLIPKWLHDVTKAEPLKVSAEWDRDSKSLIGAGIVLNPRVESAAIMAAFKKIGPSKLMQEHHDMACRQGAECGGKSVFHDLAKFIHPDELTALQHIHDHSANNGASCDMYQTGRKMYYNAGSTGKEDRKMTLKERILAVFGKALEEVNDEDLDSAKDEKKVDNAQFATIIAQNADLNKKIGELETKLTEQNSIAQFASDKEFIYGLVKDGKLTPAEATKWEAKAKDKPAVFAEIKEELAARSPLVVLRGYVDADVVKAQMNNTGSAAGRLKSAMEKRVAEFPKETSSQCLAAVFSANPGLDKEVYEESSQNVRMNAGRE